MKRFKLSTEAANDIREIWAYIAKDSIGAARRVRLQVLEACERLAENPRIGHSRDDITAVSCPCLACWVVSCHLQAIPAAD